MNESMKQDCSNYLNQEIDSPFCKGCSHPSILTKIDEALSLLKLNPNDVCLVTDIGCIGLSDIFFDKIHTVHSVHGRAAAIATGIALADKVLAEKKLKTIVLVGDGGAMFGLLYIVNAALLNSDITVIVANNFLLGISGGQQSAFTPLDFITQNTPTGNIVSPIDICNVVVSAKAEFVARKVLTDSDLSSIIAEAIKQNGFSLVEILELCENHAAGRNELKRGDLSSIAKEHGHQMGIIKDEVERFEFGKNYIGKYHYYHYDKKTSPEFIYPHNVYSLENELGIIIAGSGGEKIQTSSVILCEAALHSGLNVTNRIDHPVTQGSGFSIAEVILSGEEIIFTKVEHPSVLIIVSNDGMQELINQKIYERYSYDTYLIIDEEVSEKFNVKNKIKIPFRKYCGNKNAALGAIEYFISASKIFPSKLLRDAIAKKFEDYEEIYRKDFYEILDKIIL